MKRAVLTLGLAVAGACLQAQAALPDEAKAVIESSRRERDPEEARRVLSKAVAATASPASKRALILELASIEEFLGLYEDAAAHYSDASFAVPKERDFHALLKSVSCRLRSGDVDRADAELKAILLLAKDETVIAGARELSAWVSLVGGRTDEAHTLALALIEHSTGERLARLLFLASVSAPDALAAKQSVERLERDFPAYPETLAARSHLSGSDGSVIPYPEPYWLFAPAVFGGSVNLSLDNETPPATGVDLPRQDTVRPESTEEAQPPKAFQIGTFSKRENAERLAAELGKKGLDRLIQERNTARGTFFVVIVPVSGNADEVRMRLKDAGYEAYPVFE